MNFFTLMMGWIFDNHLEVKDILTPSRFGMPFDTERDQREAQGQGRAPGIRAA